MVVVDMGGAAEDVDHCCSGMSFFPTLPLTRSRQGSSAIIAATEVPCRRHGSSVVFLIFMPSVICSPAEARKPRTDICPLHGLVEKAQNFHALLSPPCTLHRQCLSGFTDIPGPFMDCNKGKGDHKFRSAFF